MSITVSGTTITFNDGTTQTTAATAGIPSGAVMLFVQTAAPTGWTKSATHNNKALRVVSGTAGSGGSAAFTTAFGTPSVSGSVSLSGTVGATTLTTAQMPSHNHAVYNNNNKSSTYRAVRGLTDSVGSSTTQNTGGGGSHNHSFSGSGSLSAATADINVQYVDVIIATKD